ncbi:MAG: DUF3467 domain-containing protein [Planctomycetales bacterium]|nr:DUF3467 domain-containing protein [Planctomycetales bacterium]
MAKAEEKKEEVNETAAPAAAPAEQAAAPQRVEVDDSSVTACYANFCRVNGTPEELIIDFGLNSQPFGAPQKALPVNQRLVVNYYTAKRLMAALQLSIQRHEAAFGVLETNVQKRVLPAAMRQQGGK